MAHDRTTDQTTKAWRSAAESGDASGLRALFAPNVTVISPLTAKFRFNGPDQVHEMMVAAFAVIKDIKFHTEVGDDDTRALFYHGRCGREELEEAQLLRFDADGLITELTLFGRPLPAATAVMAAIGPLMLRKQGRPGLARFIAVLSKPLAVITRLGENQVVPLADPARAKR
jgi:hypothetical protein